MSSRQIVSKSQKVLNVYCSIHCSVRLYRYELSETTPHIPGTIASGAKTLHTCANPVACIVHGIRKASYP